MNMTRKLASVVLAMILVLCVATSAVADMEGTLTGGSITINEAVVGQTYEVYQLLYLESYNAQTNAYAYKANSAWAEWLKTQTTYVDIDDQGYVTWVSGADAAAFAKAAQAYADANSIESVVDAVTATSPTVKFTNLNLGYYLVDTTLGTLCSLDTTNPTVVMEEKNEAPTVTKEVQEDSNPSWGETNDADINQVVNYKATITVQAGAENYILYDKMSEGLTFNNDVVVKVGDETVGANNYTVGTADGYTFTVTFSNDYIASLVAGTEIVVTYSATLNENAVVAGAGNPNEVKLQYGDENKPTYTPVDKTTTYTWDMEVLKYANGDKSAKLEGVKFVLLNNDKTKVATVVNGELTGWADVPDAGEDGSITWPENTTLVTNSNGNISIDGLDADTYYLREIEALPGYNKLSGDEKIEIAKATEGTDEEGNKTLTNTTPVAEINNQSGTELPSTGGMGTTLFYIAGGVLVVAAFILLVTKRRVGTEK